MPLWPRYLVGAGRVETGAAVSQPFSVFEGDQASGEHQGECLACFQENSRDQARLQFIRPGERTR